MSIRSRIKKIVSAPARKLVKTYYKAQHDAIDEKRSIIKENRSTKNAPTRDKNNQVTRAGKVKFMAQEIKKEAMAKAAKAHKKAADKAAKKKRGTIYYTKK